MSRRRTRLSLRLRAALHETRCQECRTSWPLWYQRLCGNEGGPPPWNTTE